MARPLPCGGLGGAAADPARSLLFLAPEEDVCSFSLLDPTRSSPARQVRFAPQERCDALSLEVVGDLSVAPVGDSPQKLYLIGSLSVQRRIDPSGAIFFESESTSRLLQITLEDTPGAILSPEALKVADLRETLQATIIEELTSLHASLEQEGLVLENDKEGLRVGGMAITPEGRFLLGLRSPRACPIENPASPACRAILFLFDGLDALFAQPPRRPELKARRLVNLNGGGFFSLEYDPALEGYLATTVLPREGEGGQLFVLRAEESLAALSASPLASFSEEQGGRDLRGAVPAPGGEAILFAQSAPCPDGVGRLAPLPSFDSGRVEEQEGSARSDAP